MSIISRDDMNIWWDPYMMIGQVLPYHRHPYVPWNRVSTMSSTTSNGFEFFREQILVRNAFYYGQMPLQDYMELTLVHMAKATMAASVIVRTFKKYRNSKLQRRKVLLTFALRGKVVR